MAPTMLPRTFVGVGLLLASAGACSGEGGAPVAPGPPGMAGTTMASGGSTPTSGGNGGAATTTGGTSATAGTGTASAGSGAIGGAGSSGGSSSTAGSSGTGGASAGGSSSTGGAGAGGSSGGSAGSGNTGGSGGPTITIDPSRNDRVDLDFSPVDADPTAKAWHGGKQRGTFDGSKPLQGKLVVTMGGIGNGPHTGGVYQYAAGRGFHMLAVDFYNAEGGESNQGKVYLESFSGQDLTPVANVTPTDSVVSRIKKGLAYLNGIDPGASWGFYLDAQGEVRWQDVILFGYSYGGQVALAATKYVAPFRTLLTAAPTLPDDASWLMSMPNVADVSKCFAINSAGDDEHTDKLTQAGWPGTPQAVMDGGYNMIMAPPFGGTSLIEAPGGHTEFCSVAGTRYDVICDFMFGVKK